MLRLPGGARCAPDAPKAKGSRKKATSAKKAAPTRKGGRKGEAAKAKSGKKAAKAREGSKKAEVLELMRRPKGATLTEIMKATGWQGHTVREFVSGTLIKKQGLKVESFRNDDKERTYRVDA